MATVASPERTLVAWAKANTPLNAILAGRVATKLPADPTLPFLRVRLSGGAPDRTDAPTWVPLATFDCYAADEATADVLYRTLIAELEARVVTNSHGTFSASVVGARPTPEPDTGWERITVDAVLFLKP